MSNLDSQAPTPGQPIPNPPDFSVVWEDPRDAKLTWMTIPQYKTPISPLIHAVVGAFLVGGNAGMEQAGLPFEVRVARITAFVNAWRDRGPERTEDDYRVAHRKHCRGPRSPRRHRSRITGGRRQNTLGRSGLLLARGPPPASEVLARTPGPAIVAASTSWVRGTQLTSILVQ